jgi:uncharacterized protein DUF2752
MQVGTSLRGKEEIPILLVLGVCALAAATAARALSALAESGHPFPFHCPFRMLTSLPCPACGGTRALAALALGNLRQSLAFNPLVSLGTLGILAAAGASLARRLAGGPAIRLLLSPRDHRLLRIFSLLAIGANWSYLLLHLPR